MHELALPPRRQPTEKSENSYRQRHLWTKITTTYTFWLIKKKRKSEQLIAKSDWPTNQTIILFSVK